MKKTYHVIAGLITILALFLVAASACSNSEKNKNTSGIPEAKIEGKIEGQSVRFRITIPERHHAYLDRGKEGRLIPISFDWKNALEETDTPDIASTPSGSFDQDYGATVLRGEGEFVFQLKKASELIGKIVKVKTQICDDVKGICYRPIIEEVVIN